jgi:hypothetical protein
LSWRACAFFTLQLASKLDVPPVNQMGKFVRGNRSSFNHLSDKTVKPLLASGYLVGFGAFQFVLRSENGL